MANDLHILKAKAIYYKTLAVEFKNGLRFLKIIDHFYNTRRRIEARLKVDSYQNKYEKGTLNVKLPKLLKIFLYFCISRTNKKEFIVI